MQHAAGLGRVPPLAAVLATLLAGCGGEDASGPQRANLAVDVSTARTTGLFDSIRFVLSVRNGGPDEARRVVLSARIPFVVDAIGSSGGEGFHCDIPFSPGQARCTLAQLPPERSVSVAFEGTAGGQRLTLVVTASVSAATPDPVQSDNAARARTRVSS